MKLFIGHISALEYWSTHDRDPFQPVSEAFPKPGIAPTWEDVLAVSPAQYGISDEPLHINVANPSDRRSTKFLVCHATGNSLPSLSYVRIAPSLYICSPEAALFQCARAFPLPYLLERIFELCGTYSSNEVGRLLTLHPRTKVSAVQRYANRAKGYLGSEKLLLALRYAANDSASPMETKLAILLCLPSAYGGYGIPLPKMNHPIDIPSHHNGFYPTSIRTLKCDLCWPDKSFALEYDSDQHHAGAQKLHQDSKRRTSIELERLHVVSVTSQQVYDAQLFDDLAKVTAMRLGKRLRITRKDAPALRFALREILFPKDEDPNGKTPEVCAASEPFQTSQHTPC